MSDQLEQVKRALATRYAVEREIGRGGMATVFLARDLRHERRVAIKVLHPDLSAAVGTDRFLREIKITARLNHPHILPLLDSGEAGTLLYYVMPYVDGGSLRQRLSRERPLPIADVVRIAQQAASALEHAHQCGVIHRDVKPENILFSEGHAIVADFGIAKAVVSAGGAALTRSGFPLGTPGYMSPEQAASGTGLTERTDVFGLACVVYEALVGETPELWPTEEALRVGRFIDASPAHEEQLDRLPGRVQQVLVRALAVRPRDRYPTPAEFAAALATASTGTQKLSSPKVREILARAAQLDADEPLDVDSPDEGVLSVGAVEQVAAEAGIPPPSVRRARRELALAVRAAPATFRKGRLVFDRTIAGAVPDATYEVMVDAIQQTLGFVGSASRVGKALQWNGRTPGFLGRDVRVSITQDAGQTRIHVEEHIELRGASIFVPGWGAAGGALLMLAIGTVLGLPETAIGILAVPGAISGAWLTALGVPRAAANTRRAQIAELGAQLAGIAERAALPAHEGH